jgi:hypothetical protein
MFSTPNEMFLDFAWTAALALPDRTHGGECGWSYDPLCLKVCCVTN